MIETLVLYAQSTAKKKKIELKELPARDKSERSEWFLFVCLFVVVLVKWMALLLLTVTENSVTDRRLVLYARSTAKKKKYEVIELHARDKSERSECFLLVCCCILVN